MRKNSIAAHLTRRLAKGALESGIDMGPGLSEMLDNAEMELRGMVSAGENEFIGVMC